MLSRHIFFSWKMTFPYAGPILGLISLNIVSECSVHRLDSALWALPISGISKKHGAPLRGIEPRPRRWKRRILATRPQGMVQVKNWQLFVLSINMTHFFMELNRVWHFSMELKGVLSNFHETHDYLKIWCPPLRGIEPRPRRWKRRILATRPQGMVTCVIGKWRLLL